MSEAEFFGFLKEWSPVLSLITAWLGWVLGRRHQEAESKNIETKSDAIISDIVTTRLQTLIDGYQIQVEGYKQQVIDLTTEVHRLTAEVHKLRLELATKRTVVNPLV